MTNRKSKQIKRIVKQSEDSFRVEECSVESFPSRKTVKPPFSYAQLIKEAIETSSSQMLTLKEIYTFIESKYPFYRENGDAYKNSIRHNLSLNKLFRKIPKDPAKPNKKGSYWGLAKKEDALVDNLSQIPLNYPTPIKKDWQQNTMLHSPDPTPDDSAGMKRKRRKLYAAFKEQDKLPSIFRGKEPNPFLSPSSFEMPILTNSPLPVIDWMSGEVNFPSKESYLPSAYEMGLVFSHPLPNELSCSPLKFDMVKELDMNDILLPDSNSTTNKEIN